MKRIISAAAALLLSCSLLAAQGVQEPQSDETLVKVTGVTVDSQGNYKAGAGMDGMFLQTGRVFEPIRYPDGEILAFLECQPERTRAKDREAEKTSDTVKAPEHREEKRPQKPPSLREQLRRAQEAHFISAPGQTDRVQER